jgi:S-phase kinase-associated protein 1
MECDDLFTIVSSDNQECQVPVKVAKQSRMIADLIDGTQATNTRMVREDCKERPEGVPVINAGCLKRMVEYWKYHTENPEAPDAPKRTLKPDDMCDWDKTFVSEERLEQKDLFDLILAANYLNSKDLLDVTCKALANRLKGKAPQEIVSYFKAVYPFDKEYTPEEEAAVRKEYPWIENPKATTAAK